MEILILPRAFEIPAFKRPIVVKAINVKERKFFERERDGSNTAITKLDGPAQLHIKNSYTKADANGTKHHISYKIDTYFDNDGVQKDKLGSIVFNKNTFWTMVLNPDNADDVSLFQYLYYSPDRGVKFDFIDYDKNNLNKLEDKQLRIDAMRVANDLTNEQRKEFVLAYLYENGMDINDNIAIHNKVIDYAEQHPADFKKKLKDDMMGVRSNVTKAFDYGIMDYDGNRGTIKWSGKSNGIVCYVPKGREKIEYLVEVITTDRNQGDSIYKSIRIQIGDYEYEKQENGRRTPNVVIEEKKDKEENIIPDIKGQKQNLVDMIKDKIGG